MFPDFLVDVIERLGAVRSDKIQNSSAPSSPGGTSRLPSLPSADSLLKTSSRLASSANLTNSGAVASLFSNNNFNGVTTASAPLPSPLPSVFPMGDVLLPSLNQQNLKSLSFGTTRKSPTTLDIIFKGFTMIPYYDQSGGGGGGYSLFDDDWDPISGAHTIIHHDKMTTPVRETMTDVNRLTNASSSLVRNKTTTGDVSTKYWESDATYVIIVIIFPILLAIGTLGNLITYLVLQRKTFSDKTAASWLFKCLAVMCTICLWVGLPRHWLRAFFGFDIRQLHFLLCQFHRFTLYCAMDITTWIIVSISADRLVAVLLPFKAHFISTPRNAKRLFFGLCIFFAVFNAHIFFTYGRRYSTKLPPSNHSSSSKSFTTLRSLHLLTTTQPPDVIVDVGGDVYQVLLNHNFSTPSPGLGRSAKNKNATSEAAASVTVVVSECQERDIPEILFYNRIIHPWMSFGMYVIGPFCFMLASSIIIARKLAQRRAFLNKSTTSKHKSALASLITDNVNKFATTVRVTAQGNSTVEIANPLADALERAAANNSQQRSTTMLLFAASIEFLLTATPAFFLDIAEKPLKQSGAFNNPHGMARFQLLYTVVRLLLFSNFALHFFLFCLSAHRFRREVLKVLFCCCWVSRSNSAGRKLVRQQKAAQQRMQNNEPSSTSSEILPASTAKFSDAVWRILSKIKKTPRSNLPESTDNEEDTSRSSHPGRRASNRAVLTSLKSFQTVDEITTSAGGELPHPTTPLTSSTPKLTAVDERDLLAPPARSDEPSGNNSNTSRDFLTVTPSPATLSTTGCHTGTSTTEGGATLLLAANSCGDLLMMSENSYEDDGCCDDDYTSGGAGSLRRHSKAKNFNKQTIDSAENFLENGLLFLPAIDDGDILLSSPTIKASFDDAFLLAPPPALFITQPQDERSPEQENDITLKNGDYENTLIEDGIDVQLCRYEKDLLDENSVDGDGTGQSNSNSLTSYVNNFSEIDDPDDERALEILRGLSVKSSAGNAKHNRYFINEICEPLLVTIINGTNSETQSFDDDEKSNNNNNNNNIIDTPTNSQHPSGDGGFSIIENPPLAKMESDFFRAQSRSSLASSSQHLYRLADNSFSSMQSHIVSTTGHQHCNNNNNRNNSNSNNNNNNSSYYYYSNNNNVNGRPFLGKYLRRTSGKPNSSVVYVYLTDPLYV